MRKLPAIFLAAMSAFALLAMAATRSPKGEISRNLDIFTSIYKNLQTNYVDTIDADKSMTTAINAMLNDIDPYTEYIAEKDQNDFLTISTGEYGGIGSYIGERANQKGRSMFRSRARGVPPRGPGCVRAMCSTSSTATPSPRFTVPM